MKKRRIRTGWAGLLTILAAAAACAQTPALPEGTVDDIESVTDYTVITSDKLTYDAQAFFAVFEGNVVVSDPSMKMKSERLTVRFNETNEVENILAEGRVVMSQADKRAWAAKATYDLTTGKIVLEGSPRVMRGKDLLLGDTITFWRDENRMVCEPRARLIIYPEKGGARERITGGL